MATTSESSAGAGLSPEFVKEFTHRWEAAWRSHRPEQILDCMTEDIVYDDSAWPVTMRGHAAVREFLEFTWRAFPDIEFEFIEGPWASPDEPKAGGYWVGRGTHTGPMDPPGFAPTGKQVTFEGTDFWEFRGDRLCRLRITFDMVDLSRQVGLMPAAGSRAEKGMATLQRTGTKIARRLGR